MVTFENLNFDIVWSLEFRASNLRLGGVNA
jgi:hypothetical protein